MSAAGWVEGTFPSNSLSSRRVTYIERVWIDKKTQGSSPACRRVIGSPSAGLTASKAEGGSGDVVPGTRAFPREPNAKTRSEPRWGFDAEVCLPACLPAVRKLYGPLSERAHTLCLLLDHRLCGGGQCSLFRPRRWGLFTRVRRESGVREGLDGTTETLGSQSSDFHN